MSSITDGVTGLTDQPLAGDLVAENFENWSEEVKQDFQNNAFRGRVGGRLLAETTRARIWEIRLAPGERIGAHRHVLDYFWTAINAGNSRQRTSDGTTRDVSYTPGQTRHFEFGPGEYLLHDLENIGTSELVFTTVEFLDSANPPLEMQTS